MSLPAAEARELRVLLGMATARDAAMVVQVLQRVDVVAQTCNGASDLAAGMREGAGAVILAEEVLLDRGFGEVMEALRTQPPWSDLPVVVLARAGANSPAIERAMNELSSVSVLERPMRVPTLVSTVRTALAARRRQYQLRSTLLGLQEADRRKTEFLATLAHELRNPLAPLRTCLALLERTQPDPPDAAPIYQTMGRQVNYMVRLIDDLMEVSRITRGKIELRLETLELDQVVREAIELSRPLVENGRHHVDLDSPPGQWTVRGDRVRLTQVFANLLNNAAKYTPPGGSIAIRLRRDDGQARVTIADNGLGIAPEMLASVFDMFVQASGTARAAQGGLGIGLTLVKSLVDLHGGTVTAASEGLGKGSSFEVRLPLFDAPQEQPRDADAIVAPALRRQCILVVDDNRDAADTLAALLESMDGETCVAYNGADALEIALRQQPAIAFLDIGMPGMDGYELATRLRAEPELAGMVLVALTGWGQSEDKDRIARAGFDHHLVKPADVGQIAALLAGVEGGG